MRECKLTCFKTYDVRGRLGDEFNESIAYRIGRAYGQVLQPKRVVVGADNRLSSELIKSAVSHGLMEAGVDVIDIGLVGTEEVYYSAFSLDVDGGIEVTASHNPIDFNGLKFVGKGAVPIGRNNGLNEIQKLAETQEFAPIGKVGRLREMDITDDYVAHLMGHIELPCLRPMSIVVNAGNGVAGHVVDAIERVFLEKNTPITFIKINHEPDGRFPRGIPNSLLPECRQDTIDAVKKHRADMGVAWDGDFDRCFFFDHEGDFIEGYYIVGLIAQEMLKKYPNEKVIYDPRLTWNTEDVVQKIGGIPIISKTGHVFIKERMRAEDAMYGGEMSAHHYFRDFGYCDSGMIPWLMVAQHISRTGTTLRKMIQNRIDAYPCSGEINYAVDNVDEIMRRVCERYLSDSVKMSEIDGLSMEFEQWRFNIRQSNTESLLRLNIETKTDKELLAKKTLQLTQLIRG